ncbi:hypothetical protein [Streptomyces sp. ME19-01-6]|uniref:hypothetical protein n=1 Tax=Streptomyces sp. ME19-01-6 TaxID=3028686 RepID=UPI0029BF7137|nr:hypothetical protein [Streptomyces sp. ME19-01-6]MDX3232925.1 hypothetical protein [Streptomyces sp. ME19-01-6]
MTAPGSSAAARGRGRPVAFDTAARAAFLDAVTAGAKLTEAAEKAGVSRNVAAQHAKADPAFRAALDEAKAHNRAVRAQSMPHAESRYNHAKCRCPVCCAKATAARTARRNAAEEEPPVTAEPIPLTGRPPESSTSFSLARAS